MKEKEGEEGQEREQEPTPEEDLIQDIEIPENLRPRDHINQLLKLDEENEEKERATQRVADIILRDLKRLYDNAIQPLETMYKYRDLSNRHFGGERNLTSVYTRLLVAHAYILNLSHSFLIIS